MDARNDVMSVEDQRVAARRAQRGVQDRPALGPVDLFAGEHRIAARRHFGGERKALEQLHRGRVHGAFRPVEQQAVAFERECLEASRIGGEGLALVGRNVRAVVAKLGELRLEDAVRHDPLQ